MESTFPVLTAVAVDLRVIPDFPRDHEKGTRMSSAQLVAPELSSDEVLLVARLDAERVYRELSRFVIRIARESDGWHVDFELKDTMAHGGGPHYVIDPDSGVIVTKRYEQ